jgi:ribosomal protein S18 acetylase RimI-like enzyme
MPRSMKTRHRSIVRPATANDLDAISEIEQKCFPGSIAYSKRQLAYLVLRANSATFVETCGGAIRGFVIVTFRRGSRKGHIETIDVNPAYAKLGIGSRLLRFAEEDMRRRRKRWSQLEVSEGNRAALRLYKKAGYTLKERVKRYYRYEHRGTRDALRMIKAL